MAESNKSRAGFAGPFVHYCHCGAWGSFGVDVKLHKGEPGQWYCAEHYPYPMPKATPETPRLPWPGPTSPSRCAHCSEPETRGNPLLPVGVKDHVWVHDLCLEAWRAARRAGPAK
jgi:hypothetical protein